MRVKFVSNNPHYYSELETHPQAATKGEYCVINSAYFMLTHWYDLHGLHRDQVQWQVPDVVACQNAQDLLQAILRDPPDVLALAMFIWNEQTQHWLAREYKRHRPDALIIMGGPQLTAHKDTEFFERHPYVDWAVYGDGERPFQQILDNHIRPGSVPESEIRNAVTRRGGRYHLYPYEMIQDEQYLHTSMWTGQEHRITEAVRHIESQGIPKAMLKYVIEFARGCMYNCTFCDWSQNLTNKVKRRRHDWKQEIDLFHRLDIPLRESDANFGQWPEDLEILDYANSLTDPERNFYFIPKNTPKIKKSSILYVMRKCYETHGTRWPFQAWALQDPDERVLEASDRPSIPFDEICDMVKQLNEEFGQELAGIHSAQLIIALPEQSLDSWATSLQRIWNEAGIKHLGAGNWELLPNSPGYDKDYRNKYKINTTKVFICNHAHVNEYKDLNDLYEKCADNITVNHRFSSSHFVTSNSTMTFMESLAARLMIQNLDLLADKIKGTKQFQINDIELKKVKEISLRDANKWMKEIQPLVDRYGFMVMGKAVDNYITYDTLPLRPWSQ